MVEFAVPEAMERRLSLGTPIMRLIPVPTNDNRRVAASVSNNRTFLIPMDWRSPTTVAGSGRQRH
ncbi:hypothetical protein LINGRAHAP2_LOCUS22917 [Linum grandiflorum]